MAEDFDNVYTVEVYGLEGWEVSNISHTVYQATEVFRTYVQAGIESRITSPKERLLRKRLGMEVN